MTDAKTHDADFQGSFFALEIDGADARLVHRVQRA